MSAAIGAVAGGAAAGTARRRRLLKKINKAFPPEIREDALTVFDLINERENGNAGLALVFLPFGFPTIMGGAVIGEMFGEILSAIGAIVAFILFIVVEIYTDRYFFMNPAREQLRQLVATHPRGEFIEKKVREIIADS